MSTTDTPLSERDELEMLLPWYVTGRIDAADKARIEAALKTDASLRHALAVAREEQDQTIRANEAVALPRSLSVQSSVEHILAREPVSLKQASAGLLGRIGQFFTAPTASGVRWAAAAAAIVILAQAATVGTLLQSQGGANYGTATGGAAADGAFALVRFTDGATLIAAGSALRDLGMTIVDGPKPGNVFIVRLGPKTLTAAERAQKADALRQRSGLITLVTPQP
jgi:anti-sigma factor RsiW